MAATYNTLFLDARRALRAAGSDSPQLEAQELLRFSTGKTREELYRDLPLYAPPHAAEAFQRLLSRRLAGEPGADLLGEWEFHGLPLDISPEVLIPRDDTEILAQQAIARTRAVAEHPRVLDLCAGSGCVGLAIAHDCPQAQVMLADISEPALRVCRQNIRRNGLSGRAVACQADALAKPGAVMWDFDVIASNPPYIPSGDWETLDVSVRDFEPRLALDGGEDGLDFYRGILKHWTVSLRLGGWLLCEVGQGQAPAVEELFARHGLVDIQTYPDTAGIWRVVEGRVEQ